MPTEVVASRPSRGLDGTMLEPGLAGGPGLTADGVYARVWRDVVALPSALAKATRVLDAATALASDPAGKLAHHLKSAAETKEALAAMPAAERARALESAFRGLLVELLGTADHDDSDTDADAERNGNDEGLDREHGMDEADTRGRSPGSARRHQSARVLGRAGANPEVPPAVPQRHHSQLQKQHSRHGRRATKAAGSVALWRALAQRRQATRGSRDARVWGLTSTATSSTGATSPLGTLLHSASTVAQDMPGASRFMALQSASDALSSSRIVITVPAAQIARPVGAATALPPPPVPRLHPRPDATPPSVSASSIEPGAGFDPKALQLESGRSALALAVLPALPNAFGTSDSRCGGNLPEQSVLEPSLDGNASRRLQMTDFVEGDGARCHDDSDDSDDDGSGGFRDDGTLGDLNQYVLLERLGKGAQGEVFLAMDGIKDELRAIKAVRRPAPGARVSAAKRKVLEDLAREVAIMKKLRHRNVVALHEVIDDPAHDTMYLVLQYVEHGPLASMLPDGAVSATIDPVKLVSYARQICAGLQYLHQHGVVHRDIKPENILVGANDTVYLADFGVSAEAKRVAGTRGTPAFLAPELLTLSSSDSGSPPSEAGSPTSTGAAAAAGDSHQKENATDADGEAVDVWALGITLYALLYGKLPWEFTDARDLFEAIQRRPIELRPQAVAFGSRTQCSPSVVHASGGPSHFLASPGMMPGGSNSSIIADSLPPLPPSAPSPAAPRRPSFRRPSVRNVFRPTPTALHPSSLAASAHQQRSPSLRADAAGAAPPMPAFDNLCDSSSSSVEASPMTHSLPGAAVCARGANAGSTLTNASIAGPLARSQLPTGVMPNAAADEGWRRVLYGMLQRDPRRRTKVSELRRQLASLERRMEEAACNASRSGALNSPGLLSVFTQLRT